MAKLLRFVLSQRHDVTVVIGAVASAASLRNWSHYTVYIHLLPIPAWAVGIVPLKRGHDDGHPPVLLESEPVTAFVHLVLAEIRDVREDNADVDQGLI